MKKLFLIVACTTISGCETIGNWADSAGSYMPVIGERCEHWQCFTESGRQQSEYKKQMMKQGGEQEDPAMMQQPEQPPAPPPGDANSNPYDYYRP